MNIDDDGKDGSGAVATAANEKESLPDKKSSSLLSSLPGLESLTEMILPCQRELNYAVATATSSSFVNTLDADENGGVADETNSPGSPGVSAIPPPEKDISRTLVDDKPYELTNQASVKSIEEPMSPPPAAAAKPLSNPSSITTELPKRSNEEAGIDSENEELSGSPPPIGQIEDEDEEDATKPEPDAAPEDGATASGSIDTEKPLAESSTAEEQFEKAFSQFLCQNPTIVPRNSNTSSMLREKLIKMTQDKARVEAELTHQLDLLMKSKREMEEELEGQLKKLMEAKSARRQELANQMIAAELSRRELEESLRANHQATSGVRSLHGGSGSAQDPSHLGNVDEEEEYNRSDSSNGERENVNHEMRHEKEDRTSEGDPRNVAPSERAKAAASTVPCDDDAIPAPEDLHQIEVDDALLTNEIADLKKTLEADGKLGSKLQAAKSQVDKAEQDGHDMVSRLRGDAEVDDVEASTVEPSEHPEALGNEMEQSSKLQAVKSRVNKIEHDGHDKVSRARGDAEFDDLGSSAVAALTPCANHATSSPVDQEAQEALGNEMKLSSNLQAVKSKVSKMEHDANDIVSRARGDIDELESSTVVKVSISSENQAMSSVNQEALGDERHLGDTGGILVLEEKDGISLITCNEAELYDLGSTHKPDKNEAQAPSMHPLREKDAHDAISELDDVAFSVGATENSSPSQGNGLDNPAPQKCCEEVKTSQADLSQTRDVDEVHAMPLLEHPEQASPDVIPNANSEAQFDRRATEPLTDGTILDGRELAVDAIQNLSPSRDVALAQPARPELYGEVEKTQANFSQKPKVDEVHAMAIPDKLGPEHPIHVSDGDAQFKNEATDQIMVLDQTVEETRDVISQRRGSGHFKIIPTPSTEAESMSQFRATMNEPMQRDDSLGCVPQRPVPLLPKLEDEGNTTDEEHKNASSSYSRSHHDQKKEEEMFDVTKHVVPKKARAGRSGRARRAKPAPEMGLMPPRGVTQPPAMVV